MFNSMKEAEDFIYASYLKASSHIKGKKDEETRNIGLARRLFDAIGSPDKEQASILVTGSKGKGSTSRLIASLLAHAGLKVGLFTSPHLVHFNERIRINGKAISDQDFIRLSNQIEPSARSIESTLEENEYQGPIGLALAIACLYFKEQATDINVIECGRGGAYDETNILHNEWAVITPIMVEHAQYLGPTVEDIARHKLGIIKPCTKHVYVSDQKDNLNLIKTLMPENNGASCSFYNEHFSASDIASGQQGTTFTVETKQQTYEGLELPLLGSFQAINAATAIRICEDIVKEALDETLVRKCFRSIQWPGRMELIAGSPPVVLDGAINKESARYVVQWLKTHQWKHIVSIIGVPSDKDYKGVIEELAKISKKMILTKPDITHLHFPADALLFAETVAEQAIETETLAAAVELAKQDKEAEAILIIGTQTLIANAKRLWNQTLDDIGL